MDRIRVMTKAHKSRGVTYPAQPTVYTVALAKDPETGKDSITVFRDADPRYPDAFTLPEGNKFVVGDFAEYDSYNLSYTGTITKITSNTVTITEKYGAKPPVHRLSLDTFCWRNWKFNYDEIQASNSDTMNYI